MKNWNFKGKRQDILTLRVKKSHNVTPAPTCIGITVGVVWCSVCDVDVCDAVLWWEKYCVYWAWIIEKYVFRTKANFYIFPWFYLIG